MAGETAELTTLFADVSGSTQLYEKIGDAAAREELHKCLDLLMAEIRRFGGEIIKTIGDEIMCTLPTADAAVEAACAMQQLMSDSYYDSAAPLSIRIGLHGGTVIKEAGDVFGDAVNVAARMTALAKSGQIITTKETADTLTPFNQDKTRLIFERTMVKGKNEPIDVYEVIWQEQDLTVMPDVLMGGAESAPTQLQLYCGDKQVTLGEGKPSMVMGRGAQNDLMVPSPLASRVHAKIEFRYGKFVLIDQSTNGTFITTDSGDQLVLRREESPLKGNGFIRLGKAVEQGAEDLIRYVSE